MSIIDKVSFAILVRWKQINIKSDVSASWTNTVNLPNLDKQEDKLLQVTDRLQQL